MKTAMKTTSVLLAMAWAMGEMAGEPADVRLTDDWRVTVTVTANESPLSATLDVAPPEWVTVTDERYEAGHV